MTHWSRRARWIVALAGVVFAAVVFVGIRQREKPAGAAPIPPADPRAEVEVTGATSRQWNGASENFTVRAERQFLYRDGGVKLLGVTVYVDDREGNRKFVVTGQEGEAGPKQDYVHLKGNVELISNDGLKLQTSEMSYSTGEAIVRAPGEVRFSRARLTGRGIGMTYDRSKNVLSLLDQASMTVASDGKKAGALEATASAMAFARNDKYVTLDRQVRIVRTDREITADSAVAYLDADESQVTSLDLRGSAHIVSTPTGSPAPNERQPVPAGGVEDMSARDISLAFAPDGELIERAVLTGGAAIRLAGEGGKPGRRISGQSVTLAFDRDGRTPTSLTARDRVQLEFPGNSDTPGRHVSAALLDSTSGESGSLTGARLRDDVEYREVVDEAGRVVHAQLLDLTLTPGMSGITTARFSGAVRFDQGELRATAATGQYNVDEGVLDLIGDERANPTVADTRMTVDAPHIVLAVEGPKISASEGVRSVLRTDKAAAKKEQKPGEPIKLPGFLTDNQPVNVTARTLDYDGGRARAAYSGASRLWQGDAAVQADMLTIDTRTGNLSASGAVRSTWTVEDGEEPAKQKTRSVHVATASAMEYDDQARLATYTGDAHLNGAPGDLSARKIELYLDKMSEEVARLEAYEDITFRQGPRSATGGRLSYDATEQRYVMTGTPVHITEECRESIGRTVTFYKSTDRVVVDGQQLSRTRTKSGKGCPEPAR